MSLKSDFDVKMIFLTYCLPFLKKE